MRKPVSLISGAAGFIGSHVADELIKRGHEVVILDDLSGGFLGNVPRESSFFPGSILDVELVNALFDNFNFDFVFHLAAYAAEGLSHFIKRFNYMNNVVGSVNLINAAVNHDVKCFVFTSSIAVYGAGQVPFTESMIPAPEDSYGIAKYAVERELEASHRMFGLPYIIFRPHNVFGERQNIGDKYRNVVGIWMNNILKGEPMPIFGSGSQTRAFTHVSDVAPIIADSVAHKEAYCETFNLGAHTPMSVSELSSVVANAMGVSRKVIHLPARKEVEHAFSDHSKIHSVFGYDQNMSVAVGIKQMAEWVKQYGARESKEFRNIEISKNLPPSWTRKEAACHTK